MKTLICTVMLILSSAAFAVEFEQDLSFDYKKFTLDTTEIQKTSSSLPRTMP